MVWRATMVFVAAIVTAATLWSMLVIGLGGGDAEVPGLLMGGACVVWLLAAFSWYRAWLKRPRRRPLPTDLARW